jgi:Uma2 family endonuclease
MRTALKELLHQPDLPQVLERAQQYLKEEAVRREKFYDEIDENDKAEFINGEVIMHSPVKRRHNNARKWLSMLLDVFTRTKGLGEVQDEKIMIHLSRNSFEPDIAFWKTEKAKEFDDDQMLFPAPDFVVEVLSPSTAGYDRGIKKLDYALHGVAEYWIVDPKENIVEQYLLTDGEEEYILHSRKEVGDEITSHAITGFKIPVSAIFSAADNLATLQKMQS